MKGGGKLEMEKGREGRRERGRDEEREGGRKEGKKGTLGKQWRFLLPQRAVLMNQVSLTLRSNVY